MQPLRYIRALRPINLLMTAFIMLSVRVGLFEMGTGGPDFVWYLVYTVSVMAVMAFGYLVNDYFDVETDKINKPGKNLFETHTPSSGTAYMVSFAVAAVLLPYCAFVTGYLPYAGVWINAGALLLLFVYARKGKSSVLWGNLLIASLTLLLFRGTYLACASVPADTRMPQVELLCAYALLSYVLTFVREVVKDAEDREGDLQSGIVTLATRFGTRVSRIWAWTALLPVPFLLTDIAVYLFLNKQSVRGLAFAILAVYGIFTLFILWQSHDKAGFKRTSSALKIYMLLGITSMWL